MMCNFYERKQWKKGNLKKKRQKPQREKSKSHLIWVSLHPGLHVKFYAYSYRVIINNVLFHSKKCPSLCNNYSVTLPIILPPETTTSNILLMAFKILYSGICFIKIRSWWICSVTISLVRYCKHLSISTKRLIYIILLMAI